MKVEVAKGIEELKRQFSSSAFNVTEDGTGERMSSLRPSPSARVSGPTMPGLDFKYPRSIHTLIFTPFSWAPN